MAAIDCPGRAGGAAWKLLPVTMTPWSALPGGSATIAETGDAEDGASVSL